MRIVVNHLTRMRFGRVCVAGTELGARRFVRPVVETGHLECGCLAAEGGPFDMGSIVELGDTRPQSAPPHTEDRVFRMDAVRNRGTMTPEAFWDLLEDLSKGRIDEIFGEPLRPRGRRSLAADPGKGAASLGILRPRRPPSFFFAKREDGRKLRVRVDDGEHRLDLAVTDIRFYDRDEWEPLEEVVGDVTGRMRRFTPVLLSLGLSRAFASSPSAPAACWLQANNLHLADDPCWGVS